MIINAVLEYEKDIAMHWYDDYCIVAITEAITKREWQSILEYIFDEMVKGS